MDIADLAEEQIERWLALAVASRQPHGPMAVGRCLNCDEPLPLSRRWCDAGCRDDWERRSRLQNMDDEKWSD